MVSTATSLILEGSLLFWFDVRKCTATRERRSDEGALPTGRFVNQRIKRVTIGMRGRFSFIETSVVGRQQLRKWTQGWLWIS